MPDHDSTEDWSYRCHQTHEAIMADEANLPACYSAPGSIDAWRHERMHAMCSPLIECFPDAKWMTIGDGRFASDAHYFHTRGIDALATSLTDESLKKAKDMGFIENYAIENAEHISQETDSFSFVYCKEAFHHFPRPPVALYEMLRVASRGVVLIEPNQERPRPLGFVKAIAKKTLWKQPLHFEPSGNYIYRTDPTALARLLGAAGHEGTVAYKLFNDFFHPKLARAHRNSWASWIQKAVLGIMNILCHLKLMDYGLICFIALKSRPDPKLERALKNNRFRIVHLPRNPYKG